MLVAMIPSRSAMKPFQQPMTRLKGISTSDHPNDPGSKIKRDEFQHVMNTNVAGVAIMTQTFLPLLMKTKEEKLRKVVTIGSRMGSIELTDSITAVSYRCSKAAVNMLNKCFSLEFPTVTFLSVSPGWVQTDMGSSNNRSAPLTVEESCTGIACTIEKGNIENTGSFYEYDGTTLKY